MATINDKNGTWELSIYPEAQVVEEINEPTKGYKALLGYDPNSDRHVVMYVWYEKSKYTIGDVLAKIDDMRTCPRCDALDKVRLSDLSIEVANKPARVGTQISTSSGFVQPPQIPLSSSFIQPPQNPAAQKTPLARPNVKNMFADAIFDAYLTPAGKFLVGNVFGDAELAENAFPKSNSELAELWEDTTSGRFLRNPEDAKEFMSVMHDTEVDEVDSRRIGKRKPKKSSQGIVIY